MKKIRSAMQMIPLLLAPFAFLGCSPFIFRETYNEITNIPFLNTPPKFKDVEGSPNFSTCTYVTEKVAKEGPLLNIHFMNIKNKIENQNDIIFLIFFSKENPFWYKAKLGDHITFKTCAGDSFVVPLIEKSMNLNSLGITIKSNMAIGKLSKKRS